LIDDWNGWKQVIIPIEKFVSRFGYQKNGQKINGKKDYPLTSLQFGTFQFDNPANKGKFKLIINEIELTKE